MWTVFLLTGLLATPAQQSGGAIAGTTRAQVASRMDPFEVTLIAPVHLPNGRRVGASVRPAAGPEPWWVYSRGNLCQSVITHGPVPTDATDGWKITVVERARTATQVTLGVTWLRMWERGRAVTSGSGGTSELTVQRGDRIPLDTMTRPSEPGTCAGTQKSLELHIGAALTSGPAPAGESTLDGVVDAELWMVHQAPNGVETVEHQTVRLIPGVSGFTFRSGPVETADGTVALELSGQLKAVKREDGTRGLWAGLTRSVTRQATASTAYAGTSNTTVGWLAPGEVVSFDLPPVQLSAGGARAGGGGGGVGGRSGVVSGGTVGVMSAGAIPGLPNLLEGHRLSLRVRLVENK